MQTETVRIAVDKLDPLLRQAGEMVAVKLTAGQRVADLRSVLSTIEQWKQCWAKESSQEKAVGRLLTRKADKSVGFQGDGAHAASVARFLEWNQGVFKSLEENVKSLIRSAENEARTHGAMVDDLLEDMMNVLMLPCSSILEVIPKVVRDLARDQGKEIYVEIHGGDLEIDRRILDEMKDPLIHLVRNCVDHAIEDPQERELKGKPGRGTITVAVSQVSGNQMELVVSDDGRGIDLAGVREAALKRGVLSEHEKLASEGQDALALVFRAEVSTSPVVTDISGRGIGLTIVREKVENLGGNVTVATVPNEGTSFRILLPVTLSTHRGILVSAYGQLFVIPTGTVERVARIREDSVKTIGNRETIEIDGRAIPLVFLGDVLELPPIERNNGGSPFIPALILRSGDSLVAFRVDGVLQEQEVLVRFLGKQLSRVRNVAAATVLGSGKLATILNVPDLIKSATKARSVVPESAESSELPGKTAKSILVVEDSITSRMLLKNILESSGYHVKTSVDGMDAWNALNREHYDLVVSDIQMPRMDGFQLTSSIRGDEKLAQLPIVLVTSLGSREDEEKGLEAGANAYITKGNFDQNNLLEVVGRLV